LPGQYSNSNQVGVFGFNPFEGWSRDVSEDEHAIIVDVEPTLARTYDEVASTRTMLERTEQRLDLKPDWLAADTAYGTGKLLAWLLGKNITPHIPVWERYPSADGMFSRSDFTYDAERDVYVCPDGRLLRTSGTVHDNRVRNYLSQPQDVCQPFCFLFSRVHPNASPGTRLAISC
jgi:hypothetical protein